MIRFADFDIELERSTPMPIYHQLARELERAIKEGRIEKGDYLQSEVVLAEKWQVARLTLRRAIQELVDSGLLVRRRGVGTQVVNDQIPRPPRLSSIWDDLVDQGRVPTTTVLALERVIADDAMAARLALPRGSEVVFLERCRNADGVRLAIMRSWITVAAAGELTYAQLASSGLYRCLRDRGVWPHTAARRISARVAGAVDAALLGVDVGAPLLTVEATMQDTTGTRVEFSEQVLDARGYAMELTVVQS